MCARSKKRGMTFNRTDAFALAQLAKQVITNGKRCSHFRCKRVVFFCCRSIQGYLAHKKLAKQVAVVLRNVERHEGVLEVARCGVWGVLGTSPM